MIDMDISVCDTGPEGETAALEVVLVHLDCEQARITDKKESDDSVIVETWRVDVSTHSRPG